MPVPTYDQFIEPLLRFLAENPEGVRARDGYEACAAALGLDDDDKAELLPSGSQQVYRNRTGWAHDRLKRAGLSESPKRGWWNLTFRGRSFAETNSEPLSVGQVIELARANNNTHLRQAEDEDESHDSLGEASVTLPTASPDDLLESSLKEITDSVAAELLEQMLNSSPLFFEKLVLDVLHSMGYGATRNDVRRIGGTADGGVDGVIALDRLGLENVYVQAKRWSNPVSRPTVQAFYGALAGQRARKGVIITTSSYTHFARDFADSVEGIVLINGRRLAKLMIEHGVGVSHRIVKIPEVDSDYFED